MGYKLNPLLFTHPMPELKSVVVQILFFFLSSLIMFSPFALEIVLLPLLSPSIKVSLQNSLNTTFCLSRNPYFGTKSKDCAGAILCTCKKICAILEYHAQSLDLVPIVRIPRLCSAIQGIHKFLLHLIIYMYMCRYYVHVDRHVHVLV